MIIYVAKSGRRTKVGKTTSLDRRVSEYDTHNPDAKLVPKLYDLSDDDAVFIENLAHRILGGEWTLANEQECDVAIKCACDCLEDIKQVEFFIAVNVLPRMGRPAEIARKFPQLKPDFIRARDALLRWLGPHAN